MPPVEPDDQRAQPGDDLPGEDELAGPLRGRVAVETRTLR
jgi:hypothetical protein